MAVSCGVGGRGVEVVVARDVCGVDDVNGGCEYGGVVGVGGGGGVVVVDVVVVVVVLCVVVAVVVVVVVVVVKSSQVKKQSIEAVTLFRVGGWTPWPHRTEDHTAGDGRNHQTHGYPHDCPRCECMDTHTHREREKHSNITTYMAKREGHGNSPTRLRPRQHAHACTHMLWVSISLCSSTKRDSSPMLKATTRECNFYTTNTAV